LPELLASGAFFRFAQEHDGVTFFGRLRSCFLEKTLYRGASKEGQIQDARRRIVPGEESGFSRALQTAQVRPKRKSTSQNLSNA